VSSQFGSAYIGAKKGLLAKPFLNVIDGSASTASAVYSRMQ
jgi:hypothetical protein